MAAVAAVAAGLGPRFLDVIEEDANLARVIDAAGEVIRRLFGVGQMAGELPGEVRHLILGYIRAQRLGVRRAIAQDR